MKGCPQIWLIGDVAIALREPGAYQAGIRRQIIGRLSVANDAC
jgi:hypothetical protein